ncbi:ABC transporter substrate-binding protein [Mesorhizobium koreense]|jgi:peptide/nickel transport system substrate-binding protein|uniref:ABC transporter substrate-binding protein n=1 Tax=Mesorhizobium koreense TaxID=3074855 RepID=UPI00287B9F64|nr:ABC transporter substrate-binding protein [Mesorhizobium sp. WR6]
MKLTRREILGSAGALLIAPDIAFHAHAAEPQKGGTMVMVSTQVPRHLNPAVQSGIATAVPGTQIFASPLRYDADWNPHPYLAESWKVAEDGLSCTLNLVKNAKFHDGKPVTSDDVKFSIETIKAHHPFKTMFEPVSSIETPDEHTAVIRLARPHPALLLCMSGALCPIIPKHVFGDGQDIVNHPANSNPIGSGPFKLAEFKAGEQIVLEKNPDFFIEGRPYLDKIVIRISPDLSTVVLATENGQADFLPWLAESQYITRLQKSDRLGVTDKGYAAVGPINWLAFNTAKAPLDNKAVRQAIGYAIDRNFVTKALLRGIAKAQRSPIIESSPFFNPKMPSYGLDLDKANAMLDEAGHKKGADGMRFKLTIDYLPGGGEQQQGVAQYLKSQLKKAGIDIEVRASPDFPTWAKRISNYDFDLTMDEVYNWGDPVIGVHRTYLSSNIRKGVIWSNTQQYSNPKVDELLNNAAVEKDPKKRKAFYDEFQMIVGDDLPIYWINALPYHTVYDKRLGNVPESIWGSMQSMDEVYWKEKRS